MICSEVTGMHMCCYLWSITFSQTRKDMSLSIHSCEHPLFKVIFLSPFAALEHVANIWTEPSAISQDVIEETAGNVNTIFFLTVQRRGGLTQTP